MAGNPTPTPTNPATLMPTAPPVGGNQPMPGVNPPAQNLPPHIQEAIRVLNMPPPTQSPAPSSAPPPVNPADSMPTAVPPTLIPAGSPVEGQTSSTPLSDPAIQARLQEQMGMAGSTSPIPSPQTQITQEMNTNVLQHVLFEIGAANDWLNQKVSVDYPLANYPYLLLGSLADESARLQGQDRDTAYRSFGLDPGWQKFIDDFKNPAIGPQQANQKVYSSLDPTSKFFLDLARSPLTYFPSGGLEESGADFVATHPGLVGDLAKSLIFLDAAPNKLMGWTFKNTVGRAYDLSKSAPLFGPLVQGSEDWLKNEFNPLVSLNKLGQIIGGSSKGQVETYNRTLFNILQSFKSNNIDHFAFNQITNDPFNVPAANYFTSTSNAALADAWKTLRQQTRDLNNYPAKIYATHILDMAQAAEARSKESLLGDAEMIRDGDIDTLMKYADADSKVADLPADYKEAVINQLYNLNHSYSLGLQDAASKAIEGFGNPKSVFRAEDLAQGAGTNLGLPRAIPGPEDTAAVDQILRDMNNQNYNAWFKTRSAMDIVNQTRDAINDHTTSLTGLINHPDMVSALQRQALNPQTSGPDWAYEEMFNAIQSIIRPDRPSNQFMSEARQALYSQRNAAYSDNFNTARQALADRFTNGSIEGLKQTVGGDAIHDQFLTYLKSIQAQAIGQDGMAAHLPTPLANFYNRYLSDFLPKTANKIAVDKGRFLTLLKDNQQKVLEGLGYDQPAIAKYIQQRALSADRVGPIPAQVLKDKGIQTSTQLVDILDRSNALPPDVLNKMRSLVNSYSRSGDLMFDDPLSLVSHKLGDQFVMQKGNQNAYEKFMQEHLAPINLLFQAYKEQSLLSFAYHPLVTMQELITGWMHGISPLDMIGHLWRGAYSKVPEAVKGDSLNFNDSLPELSKRAYELTGYAPDRSITSGGFGSSQITQGEDFGGANKALTAMEKLPAYVKLGVAGAQSIPMLLSGNLPLAALNMLYHSGMNTKILPRLIHANNETSRAVEVVLRAVPHTMAFTKHLSEVAPDFLDSLEKALLEPRQIQGLGSNTSALVSGLHSASPGLAPTRDLLDPILNNPDLAQGLQHLTHGTNLFQHTDIPTLAPHFVNDAANISSAGVQSIRDNTVQEVKNALDHLRQRNGLFSTDDINQLMGYLKVQPEVLNKFTSDWTNHLYNADRSGVDWANHMHFDYGTPSRFEDKLSHIVPFYIWFNRLLPFTIQHLAENPRIIHAITEYESRIREANINAGRGSDEKYNQFMGIPLSGPVADFLSGQEHSYMMADPLSLVMPGTGLAKGDLDPNSPALNQLFTVASGLGMDPYPTIPFILNAMSAGFEARGLGTLYNAPPPTLDRAAPVDQLLNYGLFQPASSSIMSAFGNPTHSIPLVAQNEQNATAEDLIAQAYNMPRMAMGLKPDDYTDIATKRILAEQSVENTGHANSPIYVLAMNNPSSPMYIQARNQAMQEETAVGTARFVAPLRTRIVHPVEQQVTQQHQQAEETYGPQLASIISRFLPSRLPLYNTYDAANGNPSIPIPRYPLPGQPTAGVWPMSVQSPTPRIPDQDMGFFIQTMQTLGVQPSHWFDPYWVSYYLQLHRASPLKPNQDLTVGLGR